MTPRFITSEARKHSSRGQSRRPTWGRLGVEVLEDRVVPDAGLPAAIIVGRTLSSYTTDGIQNNQESITFTVYNEQANPVTGVLLTDTLQTGVTIANASQLPDQSGQQLAWSLGTINGFDRTSVELTVNLPNPTPLQLDLGAQAYATLDAGAVSNSTPAATLRQGSVDPTLLASTPDANTTDPFIQEEAASLNYDAQNIFNFLHNSIGYNSYLGSVRGARGTLWSDAGNALDVASLGVALMRASGIPAQYVQGTLSSGYAQNLILSMFPTSYQTAGYLPAGTPTADPANDPQLLAETESHYWFQFDTGSGFQDADPLIGSFAGEAFAASQGTFTEVSDSLREKTEITVNAEIYSQADAAFGGTGLATTTVLDQTFNDVDLVGRPLTFGNFVSSSSTGGLAFSTVTNTYSPYLELGDNAYPTSQDEVFHGEEYQDYLTNFPLGSQFLTGLFLNITFSGPQGASEVYSRTLVDRIGFAARQSGGSVNISVSPSDPPIISIYDLYTINVSSSLQNTGTGTVLRNNTTTIASIIGQQGSNNSSTSINNGSLISQYIIDYSKYELEQYLAESDAETSNLAQAFSESPYYSRPRITIFYSQINSSNNSVTLALDLRTESLTVEAYPGQATQASQLFNFTRGFIDSALEASLIPTTSESSAVSSYSLLTQASLQGIQIITLSESNRNMLDTLNIPDDAKARIADDIDQGFAIITPVEQINLSGSLEMGWYEINPSTGEIVGVLENGGHQDEIEYAEVLNAEGEFIGYTTYQVIPPPPEPLEGFELIKKEAEMAVPFLKAGLEGLGLEVFAYYADIAENVLGALGQAGDPPVYKFLSSLFVPHPDVPHDQSSTNVAISASMNAGVLSANLTSTSTYITNVTGASWSSNSVSIFDSSELSTSNATVSNAAGTILGSGSVVLGLVTPVSTSVSGSKSISITGSGSLAFYGMAGNFLDVSGDWEDYSANIIGDLSIIVTTGGVSLNGQVLPPGTYTITTSSATLAGSGETTSPNFSGSASISTTSSTIDLGAGTGNVTIGGSSLSATKGIALTGYTGSIGVAAGGGNNTDSVTLNGSAANVLTVSAAPATITTDQNTPITFQTNVQTSFADTYTITAQALPGWIVGVDSNGNVTATPAPGLQSGTYPIQVFAQSTTNPDLIAQTFVYVTLQPTSFGIALNVTPDPLTTVPFNGAELPTAFVASIHNNGPLPVTPNLTFANIPNGFTLLDSGASVTIPSGQTGSVGVYLLPSGQIPPPGSQFSFNVSASDIYGDHAAQTVTFTVPAVDAVTLSSSLSTINVAPGATVTDPLTISNVGNVPENITLSSTATSGLTIGGLSNLTLLPGQSLTENVTFTSESSTPLNTIFGQAITGTFGQSSSPETTSLQVLVDIAVPGASAITAATAAASQLNENDLAARLNDLSGELTDLTLNPSSVVYQSQVLATLDAVIGLLAGDVYLPSLATALTTDRATLAQAVTAADVENAITALGKDLNSVATTLSDEIAHSLVLSLDPNQGQARPQVAVLYPISIQNTGTQTTTYDLSVSGLPATVTATLTQTSVTLQPGQYLFGGPNRITLSLTETGNELSPTSFTVTATAEGAPEINQTATGSLTIRNAFVQVATVTPSPSFTNPGGLVDVMAKILNVTSNPMTAQAYYTVTDPSGNAVFASTPVSVPFSSFVGFPTVDLGSFDTTGFSLGSYTINVMVTDAEGNPLTNVIGQCSVVVGSPVTASFTSIPPAGLPLPYFPYTQSITNTLTIEAQTTFPPPLTLASLTATDAPDSSVALDGALAYVGGTKDISIVDVQDPNNPTLLGTFGSALLTQGGFNVCRVSGNLLLVASQNEINTNYFNLLIYSISSPTSPTLISDTQINYQFISDMIIEGTTAYFPLNGITTFVNVILTDQFGDYLAVDFSNPSQPIIEDVLFNNRGAPEGGDYQENAATVINTQLTYLAGTTSTGSNSQTGSGELRIVNTADPTNLALVGSLDIPDTVQLVNIVVEGTFALAVGSTGGSSITSGVASDVLSGNLTLTPLDISDPLHPRIIGPTLVTQDQFLTFGQNLDSGKVDARDLGNFTFAISDTQLNGNPVLVLVNASDPNHMIVGASQTSSPINGMVVSGALLYGAGQDGLSIYNIGQLLGDPVTASVNVPTGTVVTYDPTSFNIAPSQIVHGAGFDTLTWVSSLGAGATDLTLTWTSNLASNQPPEVVPVALGATVNFISQGTSGTLTLPGTSITVTPYSFLFANPASQTVQPGATASYSIEIARSISTPDTYSLSLAGLPASWVTLPPMVTVPAESYSDVPLTIQHDAAAPPGTYNFTIVVTDGTVTNSVQITLIVQGQPVTTPIDPNSHGVVATLIPVQASAGQGTPANYVVQLTNTGSADDSFTLSALGLPAGVAAMFSQTTIDVPPGASNLRSVFLTFTPAIGTATGLDTFTITAVSASDASITATTTGQLDVLGSGVSLSLTPSSGTPNSPFQLEVTNTGQLTDTFTLAIGGPAALVSELAAPQVTLAPGASQMVSITTGSVNFAVPGPLDLFAMATSQTYPAVQADAAADLNIPPTTGMTAQFNPATQTVSQLGSVTVLLDVNNTGNLQDSYTASITDTTGPVTASLTGLDGQPVQSIPIFYLPGLSTGAIAVPLDFTAFGSGTVTVQVTSLNDPSITSTVTATVDAVAKTTTTVTSDHPDGSTYGQAVIFTATVAASGATPIGTVQFEADGTDLGAPVNLVGGTATFTTISLAASTHEVIAIYTSNNSILSNSDSSNSPLPITVTPAILTIIPTAGESQVYGSALPTLTGSARGFVNNDSNSLLAGSLGTQATASSPVGSYAFTLGTLSAGSNYTLQLATNPPTFAVTPATLTIIPTAGQSVVAGSAAMVLTYTTSGLVNNDKSSIVTGLLGTTATASSPVGTYPFTLGSLNAGSNYTLQLAANSPMFSVTASPPSPPLTPQPILVGGQPNGTVQVYTQSNGTYTLAETLQPFGNIPCDIRTAVGDVNGDGIPDFIFAIGPSPTVNSSIPGSPAIAATDTEFNVMVVSGALGNPVLVQPFDPFPPSPGQHFGDYGLFVSAGSLLKNGRDQIVVTPDQEGGPRVTIYDLNPANISQNPATGGLTVADNYFVNINANFRGGLRTAVGDLNGDGTPDLAVAAGFGGGPVVEVINGTRACVTTGQSQSDYLVGNFFAFNSTSRDGAYLAVGDVLGNGQQDLVLGPGDCGSAEVEVLNGYQLVNSGAANAIASPVALYDPTGLGGDGSGLRVAVAASGLGDQVNVVASTGKRLPGVVKVYQGTGFPNGSTSEPTGGQLITPFGGDALTDGVFVG